jgi:adenosylcobyric acid synthase
VLPGTKGTIADLAWLRAQGLAAAVQAAAAAGTPVIGICGGYQMLGRRINDPEHVESEAESVEGLGLLDVETTFTVEKRTVRVAGALLEASGTTAARGGSDSPAATSPLGPPGTPVHGYEIHMGRTELGRGAAPLLRLREADGAEHNDGAVAVGASGADSVCGSYLHGLFDHPTLRGAFLNRLRGRLGLQTCESVASSAIDDIDRLADHVEAHLDMELLERILDLQAR